MAIPYVPTTHSDGQSWTAAKANLLEIAARDAHLMPAVRVFHNANQSITDSTETTLAFNSERFDQVGGSSSTQHDTVTNNSRLTALHAGVYMVGAHVRWAANAAGQRHVSLRINGSTVIAYETEEPEAAITVEQSLTTAWTFAVNDYVEVRVFQNSGGALNVEALASRSPEFWMVRVA